MESSNPTEPRPSSYFDNLVNVRQTSVAGATEQALRRLTDASEGDVKAIASSQIELLARFYDLSLSQAGRSFRWALIASMVGLAFFLLAIVFMLWRQSGELATITMMSGALIEFIAGVNFYLYGRTLTQLSLFQGRLEVTQRFLLANSLCESLSEAWRDPVRARLINQLTVGHSIAEYGELTVDSSRINTAENSTERTTSETTTHAMAQPPA
ncbi:hypothetical protein [uncultured Thiothrix sp.]|uniref:TRADD-N-associated membrane domain-containing protein n=1 Tax=uncultured Thiothrix sp. TaxID=223185 RepID=UPI00261E6869|nr:hypothetical protein [uncultured Thiothrix sp.]